MFDEFCSNEGRVDATKLTLRQMKLCIHGMGPETRTFCMSKQRYPSSGSVLFAITYSRGRIVGV
jgi:hypothetical protein